MGISLKWVLIFAGLFLVAGSLHPSLAGLVGAIGFFVSVALATARRHAPAAEQTATFLPRRGARTAQPAKPKPFNWLSPVRSLLSRLHPKAYAYFRAVLGFMIALGIMFAFRGGVKPQTGTMSTLSILFPTLVLATMLAPVLIPVIERVAAILSGFGIRRGFLDVLVGIVLSAIYWLPSLSSALQKGGPELAMGIGFAFAGAFAGFEFWRAEGYPGARRTLAQWLGSLRDGFLQGLGR